MCNKLIGKVNVKVNVKVNEENELIIKLCSVEGFKRREYVAKVKFKVQEEHEKFSLYIHFTQDTHLLKFNLMDGLFKILVK